MKVLVLGATGFIGQHVCSALSGSGYEVIAADIVLSAYPGSVMFDRDSPDFIGLLESTQPDVCVNCTGAASVPLSFTEPFNDYVLNTLRIAQLLDAIRMVAPQVRFIHLSSAAVYGNPAVMPINENVVSRPVSPYGWHKQFAEGLCKEYAQAFGIQTLSLRVFSAYGPGLSKQIFWDVYQKGLRSEQIELFGTGNESRDFIYIEDIAQSICLLINAPVFDGRAINVASGRATTTREAVTALVKALGWQRKLVFSGAERVGDPTYWCADISELRKLGVTPAYTIEQGLNMVAKWLKDQ